MQEFAGRHNIRNADTLRQIGVVVRVLEGNHINLRRPDRTERSFFGISLMKKADRMEMQAAHDDPVHGGAADARDWQQECFEPPSHQDKNLRIPNTTPE